MSKIQIFMPLLNEGTDVWRPVEAERISYARFRVLGEAPDDEEWQFAPGTTVGCRSKVFSDGTSGLVAVDLDEGADEMEIGRAAHELSERHGWNAHKHAGKLASQALADGDDNGHGFWRAVERALRPR